MLDAEGLLGYHCGAPKWKGFHSGGADTGTFAPNYGTGNLDMTQDLVEGGIFKGCMSAQILF